MNVGPHVMYAPSMYLRYVGMYRSCTFIINYYLCPLSVIRYFLYAYIMILYLYYIPDLYLEHSQESKQILAHFVFRIPESPANNLTTDSTVLGVR